MRVASSLVAPDSLDAVPYERLCPFRCPFYDCGACLPSAIILPRGTAAREDVAEWQRGCAHSPVTCNFQSELDIMLRDRFILGLQDVRERERLFTEDAGKITFVAAMELVQSVQRGAAAQRSGRDSGGASSVGGVFALKTATGGQGAPLESASMGGGARSTSEARRKYFQCSVFRGNANHNAKSVDLRTTSVISEKGHLRRMWRRETRASHFGGGAAEMLKENVIILNVNGSPLFVVVTLNRLSIECEVDSGSAVSAMSNTFYTATSNTKP
ncbi:hypothetical protein EVAR_70390_1 [Eumeta japonica]|uniref:Uncharacterized protein n=1 Tax=Eumeta variegata TaxID=151549 RepID=A0A4C2A7G4_EUMVA|nr:hypothetical protein EVAR_70390_1 [Eumeta japonica]